MTHKTTWANSDSLTIGFGPNYPEREKDAVAKTFGQTKLAKLHFTHESTFGENATYIQLPRNAVVESLRLRVDATWTSSDASLAIGHTEAGSADVDAFMTITEGDHGATKLGAAAGTILSGDGAYFTSAGGQQELHAVLTDDADDATKGVKVFITSTEGVAWSTGEATLFVEYRELGY